MTRRAHVLRAVGVVLAIALTAIPATSRAAAAGPSAEPPNGRQTSSWWLKTGETRQEQGDYAGAGQAYGQALDGLSEHKQRANVGARTAMLSAEAYFMAFEADGDLTHLRAGFEVLDRWIKLAGPGSSASLLPRAERMAARFHAIHDPLQQAEAALADDDLERASKHYQAALEALAVQRHPWPIGARITLRVARAHVEAYDQSVAGVEDIEPNRPKLETAKGFLERWKGRRPSDDESEQGPAIDALLAEIQARLDEGTQAIDAALAEQQRQAAQEAREAEQRRQAAEEQRADDAAANDDQARKQRRLGIILLSTGVTATAAGAGLLGEGLAFRSRSRELADAEQAEAQQLTDMYGDRYSREDFDTSLAAYRDDVRRRNTGLIIGGSVLAAGGIAASVVGILQLVRSRKGGGSPPVEQARLLPSVSRSQVRLSLTARF